MHSTAQAIHLFTLGLANAIAAGLTVAFSKDIPDDLNNGNLEFLYYSIAGFQVIAFFAFAFSVRNFKYNYGYLPLSFGGSVDDTSGNEMAILRNKTLNLLHF